MRLTLYQIILWTPRLWQLISVEDCHSSSNHQAKLWIERSFPLPFDVEINLTSTDTPLALLSTFLSSVTRWQSLTLTGKRTEYVDMSIYDRRCLLWSNADIIVGEQEQHSDVDDSDDDEDVPIFSFFFSPMVYPLFVMKVNISAFPDPTLMSPMQFTSITIRETTGMAIEPASIIHFLRACPSLHLFCFTGCQDNPPFQDQTHLVHLPFLRTLKLKNTCSARMILSSLHTPALETLCLAHLNVAFQLWHNAHNEEGDSDDEANDFSQSPSSDRATGMGLRSLIKLSKPPLRSLEMNFSDMRTKDFKYVFDSLPTLTRFSIVASDMSDKVIDLLRPIRLQEEKEEEEEGGGNEPSLRVRLPHLRNLELYNCQRLSGPAVIKALVERVRFTNPAEHAYASESPPNINPSSYLEEVIIAGCDGFNSGHAIMLAEDIGDRIAFQHM